MHSRVLCAVCVCAGRDNGFLILDISSGLDITATVTRFFFLVVFHSLFSSQPHKLVDVAEDRAPLTRLVYMAALCSSGNFEPAAFLNCDFPFFMRF